MFVPVRFDMPPIAIRPARSMPVPPKIALEPGVTTDFTLIAGAKGGPTLANFVVVTADELEALSPLKRQVTRRAAREQPLMRRILRAFLERGGPIPGAGGGGASAGGSPRA